MSRNNQRIKIVTALVNLIVVIPVLLFVIGARNYAMEVLITSLFGMPMLIILWANQMEFERHVKIPKKIFDYGRVFFALTFIIGLVMMLLDKDGIWGPTFYQITASILIASSTIALSVAKK